MFSSQGLALTPKKQSAFGTVFFPYIVDPVIKSRDSSEDGGLLHKVAAQARNETGDAVNLPGSIAVLAVQRATRVALDRIDKGRGHMFYSSDGVAGRLGKVESQLQFLFCHV